MLFAELMEQILRTFNRSSHELRIEHHVKGINAEMVFGLLLTTVHFNGITHSLEGMEGETDRQYDI